MMTPHRAPGYRTALVLLVLAIAAFLVVTGLLMVFAPDPVPSHFTADGEIDGYSSKVSMLAVLMPIGAGLPILLGIRWPWGRRPAMLNVPHRDAWIAQGRREELTDRVVTFMRLIGALCALLLGAILAVVLLDALADVPGRRMPGALLPAVVVAFLVGTVACIVKLSRDLSLRALEALPDRTTPRH